MTTLISIILFLIFLFLSVIHIYWGFGGKWGKDAAIPAKPNPLVMFGFALQLFQYYVLKLNLLD